MDIRRLVADFTERLHAAVDQISVARAREAVMHALGEKRGRLPKGMAAILGRKPRRKAPRQLCPVPGCQNPAAPVFGMVCSAHRDVPKTKIKQYREARRAAKLRGKDGAAQPAKGRARSGAPAGGRPSKDGAGGSAATKKAARPAAAARRSKTDGAAKRGRAGKTAAGSKAAPADRSADHPRPDKGEANLSPPRSAAPSPEMTGAAP